VAACAGRISLLVVDFDDTCTQGDTIGVLLQAVADANARAAAAAAAGAAAGGAGGGADAAAAAAAAAADAVRQQQGARAKQLGENYVARQQQLLQRLLPAAPDAAAAAAAGALGGTSHGQQPPQQYNARGLRAFCEALSAFDTDMNQVVIDAGALKGVRAQCEAARAHV
jgi:pyruvate/2-oxoglutarate dehydrogenase complex dihydrolipoamide acyltransferase (E2) component